MATPQVFDQGKYDTLTNQVSGLQKQLDTSPSAYTDNTDPTFGDISAQAKANTAQTALDKQQALKVHEAWYGPGQDETTQSGTDEGLLSHGLRVLGTPLNAVVGATSWALGEGTNNDLGQSISGAINTQKNFGSLLQQYNLPGYVQAPLGFALDVAFDPVNWATAGTSALVPRVATGLVKGGLEGAKEGFISRAGSMATKLLTKVTPQVKAEDRLIPGLNTIAQKTTPFINKIGESAINASDRYDTLVRGAGNDITSDLGKGILGAGRLTDEAHPATLGNYIQQAITDHVPNGDKIVQAFKFSNGDWFRQEKQKTQFLKLLASNVTGEDAFGNPIPDSLDLSKMPIVLNNPAMGNFEPAPTELMNILKQIAQDSLDVSQDSGAVTRTMNSKELGDRMLNEAMNNEAFRAPFEKALAESGLGQNKTGVDWYDNTIDWIKKGGIGKKLGMVGIAKTGNSQIDSMLGKIPDQQYAKTLLNAYQDYMSLFKITKVGLSPTAWTNAVLGNPVMAHLAGIDVTRKDFYKSLADAAKYHMGFGDEEYVQKVFNDKVNGLLQFSEEYPDLFSNALGIAPDMPKSALRKYAVYKQMLERDGVITDGMTDAQAKKATSDFMQQLKVWWAENNPEKLQPTPSELKELYLAKAKESGVTVVPGALNGTGYVANELEPGKWVTSLRDHLSKSSENPKNYAARILNTMLNDSMSGYEKIDQSYKLGMTDHLMNNGLSENELRLLSRVVGISPSDITSKFKATNRGEYLYRLSGEKAVEAANEIYMNYAAMPGAVKVLRSIPLVGGPFSSYAYAMSSKIGKSLIHNPASFGKLNNLMNEMQGQKSPIEKEELKSKYYDYLNKPGVMRLSDIGGSQFMHDNPIYLDLTNMIPYYNMNSLTPANRKYTASFNDQMLSALDQSPILKDPVGSTIFDYFILPLMLGKGEIPQNSFGQPVYPIGASGIEKAGYAARSLGDTVAPGVLAPLGLAQGAIAPGLTPYMPMTNKWRTLANATQNQDKFGAPYATPRSLEQIVKGMAGYVGANYQDVNANLSPAQLNQLVNQSKQQ